MFDSKNSQLHQDATTRQDQLKSVEPAVNFRQMTCYNCGHTAVYRFRTTQIRRNPEAPADNEDPGLLERWKSIPRFAEIPEVIKCENCGEILGSFPEIIF